MRFLSSLFWLICSWGLIGLLGFFALFAWVLTNYGTDIPDFKQLKDYQPPVVTRVFTGDGRLMAEFAEERRVFVPITAIPPLVRQSFLSAEDKNFYQHRGLDFSGIGRAILTNLRNLGSDNRMVGASTITQQVAKNMLLTNEVSFERKFKEAILAIRMEKVMSKDRLLELYLNEIYLGQGAYGVAAAAQIYFNKGLDDITVEEAAYLASLPKAPNNYHPIRRKQAALDRRNWVIGRMEEDGYITREQMQIAQAQPLLTNDLNREREAVRAPYFAEEIRRFLRDQYGLDGLYKDGLIVRSTMNPDLQEMAERAFRYGMTLYDRRHGWRGAVAKIDNIGGWSERLATIPLQKGMLPDWALAVVLKVSDKAGTIGLVDGTMQPLHPDDAAWASGGLAVGDVVMVSPKSYLDDKPDAPQDEVLADGTVRKAKPEADDSQFWRLRQVPNVQGGLVVMDPFTGRVLAMQGGWDYEKSEFNRVTQAKRQLGSAFKPFIYLPALEDGYTPSTTILDAPISFSMGYGQGTWSPTNYDEGEYYGPTTIRVGIEKSRNLMTVRLASHIGMKRVAETVERFGIYDKMQTHLANSLGAQETTLLRLTTAYAMLVNGAQRITPTFIDRVQDRTGTSVYSRDKRQCFECGPLIAWTPGQPVPEPQKEENLVTDPRVAYQMVSILEGVIQRGTASSLKDLDYPLAGKTGTTNDNRDAWFIGFSPELVVGAYVGFDQPKSLGAKETGGRTAVPLFKAFMKQALAGREAIPFRIPAGMTLVEVNATTGRRTSPDDPNAILEAYLKSDEEQSAEETVIPNPDGVTVDTTDAPPPADPRPAFQIEAEGDIIINDPSREPVPSSPDDEAPIDTGVPQADDGTAPAPAQPQPTAPIQGTGGLY